MSFELGSLEWYLALLILGIAVGFLIALVRKMLSEK